MSAEYPIEIEDKHDKRWHADGFEIAGGISSVGLLIAGHFLGGTYTTLAFILASTDLAALQSKAENVARSKKQNNTS